MCRCEKKSVVCIYFRRVIILGILLQMHSHSDTLHIRMPVCASRSWTKNQNILLMFFFLHFDRLLFTLFSIYENNLGCTKVAEYKRRRINSIFAADKLSRNYFGRCSHSRIQDANQISPIRISFAQRGARQSTHIWFKSN